MKRTLACVLLFLFSISLFAAEPKVAVVLSGGGARGLAHIAVLEALEEKGIPIDMIVGTSIGSLIGGLYSAGYTPKEIRGLLETYNLVGLFTNSPLDEEIPDDEVFSYKSNHVFSLGFGDQGLGDAPALIGDQRILELLGFLFSKYPDTIKFSDLPTSFYCVAADAVTGERIVYSSGSLVQAIRSSIAIPIVFTPYPQGDGTLAVDGGVVDNLPVQLARDLGADYVIASDVNAMQMGDGSKLETLSAMAMQTVVLLTQEKANAQHNLADVLILPDLADTFPLDFASYDQIIEKGRIAAQEQSEALDNLAKTIAKTRNLKFKDPDRYGEYRLLPTPTILQIQVTDTSLASDTPLIKASLFSAFLGRKLDKQTSEELDLKLREVRTANDLTTLSYEMGEDGMLMINSRSFARSNRSISMGFQVDVGFSNALPNNIGWYRADAFLDAFIGDLGTKDLTFLVHAMLGQDSGIGLGLRYPLIQSGMFTMEALFNARYASGAMSTLNSVVDAKRTAPLDRRFYSDLGFQFKFGKYGKATLTSRYSLTNLNDDRFSTKLLAYPEGELSVSYGNLESRFATSGILAETLVRVGAEDGMTYALRLGWKQVFKLTYLDAFTYSAQLSVMREPYALLKSYANIGSLDYLIAYGPLFLRRDVLFVGMQWQHRLTEIMGYPTYAKFSVGSAVYDGYDPFTAIEPTTTSFFEDPVWDVGVGIYVGLDAPIGEVIAAIGASLKGYVTVSMGVY